MNLKVVIAGRGGEGIVFLTRVLAEGAWRQGIPVISTETHGMAQRGGSVISQVKLGDFMSPMLGLGEADLLIATSPEEAERTRAYLREGGMMVVNSPSGPPYCIDARRLAEGLGHRQGTNLVLLGLAVGLLGSLKPDPFLEAIEELSGPRWAGKNKEAFSVGLSTAQRLQRG